VVARFAGNTSASALRLMLLVSDNDIAEMMLRNSAVAATATVVDGGAEHRAHHASRGLGVDTTGWVRRRQQGSPAHRGSPRAVWSAFCARRSRRCTPSSPRSRAGSLWAA
jgi:hypothetical protein